MDHTYHVATEKRPDGLFAGTAWTQDHASCRAVAVDYADRFTTREAARKWAQDCRKAQRKAS